MISSRLTAAFAAAVVAIIATDAAGENRLANPPGTVDGLLTISGARELLVSSENSEVVPTPDGRAVELAPGARAGSFYLPSLRPDFPFNELLPSWNGWAPADGGFRVYLRASAREGQAVGTPWIPAGSWGKVPEDKKAPTVIRFSGGLYEYDTLMLGQPADAVDVRVDLFREKPGARSPRFETLYLSYTNSTGDKSLARRFGRKRGLFARGTSENRLADVQSTVSVPAPYHSQVLPRDKGLPKKQQWVGRVCAPCTVNSALGRFGIERKTEDVAAELFDPKANAFGVWHRSVQGAAQHGIRGYVHRFRNWSDVVEHLRQGHVIVASIRFEPGEVNDPLANYGKRPEGTKGHLVLIKGVAPGNRVIVHDSASKDFGPDSVWAQEDLARAWFDKGGVAYVFTGKQPG